MENLLSITVFTPLLAGLILAAFLRGEDITAQRNAKWVTLIATTLTFLVSLFIYFDFDTGDPGYQFVEERPWVLGLQYKLGVDGISVLFVLLTTSLMPLIVASAWNLTHRVKEYMISFLFLETLLLGTFASLDVVLFLLFFEATVIPLFLIIGIWGGTDRLNAAFKMVVFSGIGAVLMLTAMLLVFREAGSTDIEALTNFTFSSEAITILGLQIPGGIESVLCVVLLLGLLIRFAFWPLHRWMLDAQVQAPPTGSIVLAALIVNMAGYGLLRFVISMFPIAADALAPILIWVAAFTAVYAILAATSQRDMKRLIGYFVIAQVGFATIGIFSVTTEGVQGAIIYLISQSVVVAALLICLSILEQRTGTRDVNALGGLMQNMPRFALFFMIFAFSITGVPGTGGFVGVLLTLMGVIEFSGLLALVILLCWVTVGGLALGLYRKVMFGNLIKGSLKTVADLTAREKAVIAPLMAVILVLGIFPVFALDMIRPTVEVLVANYQTALAEAPALDRLVELNQ